MDQYRSSVKCKYCRHYEDSICNFHNSYQRTNPNNVCKNFMLSDMDIIAHATLSGSNQLYQRNDGSYIANIDDVPSLKAEFEYERQQKEEQEARDKAKLIVLAIVVVIAGIVFLWPFISLFLDIFGFIFGIIF